MEEINKEELERDKELKDQQEEVQKEFKGFFESLKEYSIVTSNLQNF